MSASVRWAARALSKVHRVLAGTPSLRSGAQVWVTPFRELKWSSDLGQFLRFWSRGRFFPCPGCLVLVRAVRADVVVVLIDVDQYVRNGLPG